MDRALIEEKLEALRRCVARIQAKCPGSAAELAADPDLQDILAVNLVRAVQLCVDIAARILAEADVPAPATMGEAFERLAAAGHLTPEIANRLKKAVGFRNIAVHNYSAIDWNVVHGICTERLVDFRDFAAAIARRL